MSHSRVFPDGRAKKTVFVCIGEESVNGSLRREYCERLEMVCAEYQRRTADGSITDVTDVVVLLSGGVMRAGASQLLHLVVDCLTDYAEQRAVQLPTLLLAQPAESPEECVQHVETVLQEQKIRPIAVVLVVPARYAVMFGPYVKTLWPKLPLEVLVSRDRRSWLRRLWDTWSFDRAEARRKSTAGQPHR